jgi:hypothetical protein
VSDGPSEAVDGVEDLAARVRRARERVERADRAVEAVGEADIDAVASAHREALKLLDGYEDSATGTGDFEAYVRFQEAFADLVEGLDEDLPERESFEAALDAVDGRRLSVEDFDRARRELADAGDLAERLTERENARERLREVERELDRTRDRVDEQIAELEELVELGQADLEADVSRLREPITAYDEAVRAAFADVRSSAPARELLGLAAESRRFPLATLPEPPAELLAYVRSSPAGEETVDTLREYAGYSRSKLDHYVEDPAELKRRVGTHTTYLERLEADPLTVGWPPPPAADLRHRSRELVSVVARFADDAVVERARRLGRLARDPEYPRLRRSAVARDRIDETTRERLAAGEVAEDLDRAREARDRLAEL